MKALVAGWFSFEQKGASAGDLLAKDVVCGWLESAGASYEVALAPPFEGGVSIESAEPAAYTHLVFVCGPFGKGRPITTMLDRFRDLKLIGLDLSLLEPLTDWNPFDLLIERDSSRITNPDFVFASPPNPVPLAGLVLIDTQRDYEHKDVSGVVNAAITTYLQSQEAAVVPIDTRLDVNRFGLRTPHEIETLISRTDLVVTTRLHGMVLALKNGVPALAVDSVRNGGKVSSQARAVGWPVILAGDALTPEQFNAAFEYCLTGEARKRAKACASNARSLVAGLGRRFIRHLREGDV